jgi:hypothetical protein
MRHRRELGEIGLAFDRGLDHRPTAAAHRVCDLDPE